MRTSRIFPLWMSKNGDLNETWLRLLDCWTGTRGHTPPSSLSDSRFCAEESSNSLFGSWSAEGRSGSVCDTVEASLSGVAQAGISPFTVNANPNNNVIYSRMLLNVLIYFKVATLGYSFFTNSFTSTSLMPKSSSACDRHSLNASLSRRW